MIEELETAAEKKARIDLEIEEEKRDKIENRIIYVGNGSYYYRLAGRSEFIQFSRGLIRERVFKYCLEESKANNEMFETTKEQLAEMSRRALAIIQKAEEDNYCGASYKRAAAHKAGIHSNIDGDRYLVANDYNFPTAKTKEGEFPTITNILKAVFDDPEHPEQYWLLLAWLKGARENILFQYRTGKRQKKKSQLLTVVGEQGVGKTLILDAIFTHVLGGGTPADISRFLLTAGKGFNSIMLPNCLLAVDDGLKDCSIKDRKDIFTSAKQMLYSAAKSVECKGKDEIKFSAPWVVVMLMNKDDGSIKAYPIIEGKDLEKVLSLYAGNFGEILNNGTNEEKDETDRKIEAESFAFCHWLDNWQVPAEYADKGRNHARSWQSPRILELVNPISEEGRVLEWIDQYYHTRQTEETRQLVNGGMTAGQILSALQSFEPSRAFAKVRIKNELGKMLKKIVEIYPNRLRVKKTNGLVYYVYIPPAESGEDVL